MESVWTGRKIWLPALRSFLLAILLTVTGPAQADLPSGEVGIFLEPTASINEAGVCPQASCHPELWELTEEGLRYSVHVLARDLEGGALRYEFALQTYVHFDGSWAHLSPSFPEGATYWEWSSAGTQQGSTQLNYAVELPSCMPGDGLVSLARFDVLFESISGWVHGIQLVEARRDWQLPTGYGNCSALDPEDRKPLPVGAHSVAAVVFPDPIDDSSWGRLKTVFR